MKKKYSPVGSDFDDFLKEEGIDQEINKILKQRSNLMRIQVHLKTGCKPIVHANAGNTFMKGNLFCVMVHEEGNVRVYKYPVIHIFRIIED